MTESDPGPPEETPEETREPPGPGGVPRDEVMKRLAEILKAGPPDLSGSGGPVVAGGFPPLPGAMGADEFDQESAAALFAALGQFFEQQKEQGQEAGSEGPERE